MTYEAILEDANQHVSLEAYTYLCSGSRLQVSPRSTHY